MEENNQNLEDDNVIESLYTINLKDYFNSLQQQIGFPKNHIEELFIISKLAEDEEVIAETARLINEHASKSILKAFSLKKTFPGRHKKNSVDVFLILLGYAKKAPDLDIGKMYELLGFDELFFNDKFKDESLPIELTRFNRVTKISIRSKYIKSIPSFINELKSLEEIKIDSENISSLPQELSKLPSLKKLDINFGPFSSFPNVIFSLQHLESLKIVGKIFRSKNITSVQIPAELNQLSNLKELSIFSINQEKLPEDLFNMPNLESLELVGFAILTSFPSSIKSLKKLKSLKISNCSKFEKLPNEVIELKELEVLTLAFLPSLKEFDMDYFGLPKIKAIYFYNLGPFSIKKTTQKESLLKKIDISHPTVFEFVFNNVDMFKNLEKISITEETTLDFLPASSISNFQNLHTLTITCENPELLEGIGQLSSSLRILTISYNQGNLPNSMTRLHQLEKLTIKSKSSVHFSKIPSAKNNQVKIEAPEIYFDIKNELYIKELIVNGNVKNIENISYLKELEVLEINSRELNNIPNELGNLSELKKLNLYGKFKSIPPTIGNLSSLEELFISTAYGIPTEKNRFNSIPKELSKLKSLKKLIIENYEGANFDEFLSGLSNLEKLELNYCHKLIELPKEIKELKNLSEIKINMCDQFSNLNGCLENLSKLKRLYIWCDDLKLDQFDEIAKINQLEELSIHTGWNDKKSISEIPSSLEKLKNLKVLELQLNNVRELPEFIDQLKNLEELYIDNLYLKTLPVSLINLPKLKKLSIPTSIEYLSNELRKLNLDILFLWGSKFGGYNVKQEVYGILIGPNTERKGSKNLY